MIKSVLAAAAAAIALAAPFAVQAQPAEPIAPPLPNDATNARVISGGPMEPGPTGMAPDINTAIIGQPAGSRRIRISRRARLWYGAPIRLC